MKRKSIILAVVGALILAAFWPWFDNPFSYAHLKDIVRTSTPISWIFGKPCSSFNEYGIALAPSYDCFRLEKPRTFNGIWMFEFEGSNFYENATAAPTKRPPRSSRAWLNYDPELIDPSVEYGRYDEAKGCYVIEAFEMSFVGQRSPNPGGHMGMSASEIWPQRIISAKRLPAPDCSTY